MIIKLAGSLFMKAVKAKYNKFTHPMGNVFGKAMAKRPEKISLMDAFLIDTLRAERKGSKKLNKLIRLKTNIDDSKLAKHFKNHSASYATTGAIGGAGLAVKGFKKLTSPKKNENGY